jgi:hypothetical protein
MIIIDSKAKFVYTHKTECVLYGMVDKYTLILLNCTNCHRFIYYILLGYPDTVSYEQQFV